MLDYLLIIKKMYDMKKKILLPMVVVAIAVFASYNVYISNHSTILSDLVLANVEALASDAELPEVTITCGKKGGACWRFDGFYYEGEYTYKNCIFNGITTSFC